MVVPNFDPEFLVLRQHLKSCFYRSLCVNELKKELSEYAIAALELESVFKLVLKASVLCSYLPTSSLETGRTVQEIEQEIRKLEVDSVWQNALKFAVSPLCNEDDLSCEGEFLITPEVRVERLLAFLVLKLEEGFGEALIEQGILSLLLDIYLYFSKRNFRVSNNALKALSNIAMQSQKCAAAIGRSEWLYMLSFLIIGGTLEEVLLTEKICVNALSTFKAGNPRLRTNMYQLYCSDAEPVVDIVFVHGLKGSVFRTWRERDDFSKLYRTRCWPRDWLPKDLSVPFRVLAIDYATSLIRFTRSSETLSARSQRFILQLREAGVGSRPVIFICHSMGGLLVKNLLLDDRSLLKQTFGILFFATPHQGSPIAKYGYIALRPADDVIMLRYNNLINKKLHEDFLLISHEVPVITSVLETEEAPLFMGRKGVLVPWESAFFEYGSVYHVKDFHYNVCKPRNRMDNIYKIVMQFIGDALYYIKEE